MGNRKVAKFTFNYLRDYHKIFFVLCASCLVFSVLSMGCFNDLDLRLFHSSVDYDLIIYVSEPITNSSFYIPLPVKNGIPMIGERILKKEDFQQSNIDASFISISDLDNIHSENKPINGQEAWFVKISAEKIVPENNQNFQYRVHLINNSEIQSPLSFINTLYPFGNESVFLPKSDFFPITPMKMDSNDLKRLEYINSRIPYEIPVYCSYSGSPSVEVRISSRIRGNNEWKEHYDSWIGNSYSDYFDSYHTGTNFGWQSAQGEFNIAQGVYPNLSSPEWQKVIEKSSAGK